MKTLSPGQAAVARLNGKVALVVCDHREALPLGSADIVITGAGQDISVAGVTVPVIIVALRLTAGGESRYYMAWINELADNVLESLATQPDLPVLLASPLGESVAQSPMENNLRSLAQVRLGPISILAEKSPWQAHHFAAARSFIETRFPTGAEMWAALWKMSGK